MGRKLKATVAAHPRHVALAALAVGLISSRYPEAAVAAGAAIACIVAAGSRRATWAVVACALVAGGHWLGGWRLDSIESNALQPLLERQVEARGYLVKKQRPIEGRQRFRVELVVPARGTVQASYDGPPLSEPIGAELSLTGRLEALPERRLDADFDYGAYLRRSGVHALLRVERVRATGRGRGGVAGLIDAVRRRAEGGVAARLPEGMAALGRGMVLGQDEQISDDTNDDFKASGLAHLLAVSGQNVTLLALLAFPLLGLARLNRRARLACVLGLIALYVPLTGAGPSIVRAGIMGAAAVCAALAGRPASRWYALLAALCGSLVLDPRAWQDVGWQLSFAAVVGIFVAVKPLLGFLERLPDWLAEGLAMTLAATLTTAPLLAYQFGQLSLVSVLANVVALPAVAPIMWLGMLASAVGQVSVPAAGLLNALNGFCLAYISEVARVAASLPGATVSVEFDQVWMLVGAYASMAMVGWAIARGLARPMLGRARQLVPLLAALAAAATAWALGGNAAPAAPAAFRMTFFDVGQGDAALIQTPAGANVLIDTGPPGAGLETDLEHLGVSDVDALFLTHPQDDHVGGTAGLLERVRIARVFDGAPSPAPSEYRALLSASKTAGAVVGSVAAGDRLTFGELAIEVLNPPRGAGAAEDPNVHAVVLRVSFDDFDALLTADAEVEATGVLDTTRLDLLKVAHHGSADSGLPALLARTSPRAAVISVGAANSYGHPHPSTLAALAAVPELRRTDRDGDVTVELAGSVMRVRPG